MSHASNVPHTALWLLASSLAMQQRFRTATLWRIRIVYHGKPTRVNNCTIERLRCAYGAVGPVTRPCGWLFSCTPHAVGRPDNAPVVTKTGFVCSCAHASGGRQAEQQTGTNVVSAV
eukprot:365152-Chlamydomonas_euryale.AAC.13